MTSQKEINETFIKKYNELDALIEEKFERFEEDSSIYFLINKFRKSTSEIERTYSKQLDSIRKIRNLYVHESGIFDELFIVSNDLIKTLNEIIDYLTNPIRAKDIMTPFSKLKLGFKETKITDLIATIYRDGFSHIPLVDESNKVIGVFNSDVLLTLTFHKEKITKENTVLDFLKYMSFDAHFNTRFIFVDANYEIDVLNSYFIESKELYKKRLPIIFVTSNGKSNGTLIGIISPIDLIKVKK